MSEYKRLGTARLLRDNGYAGSKGDVVDIVSYPDDRPFGPAQDDGSDSHGDFWAIPLRAHRRLACIGKPGCGFEWVTRESTDLKEGDVVRAKCKPSPEMVVLEINTNGDARVMWFNNGDLRQAVIHQSVLVKVL